MVRIVHIKLKGSSIVEVTVAMVIASISFVLAAGFFWQLSFSSLYRQPVKAQQLAISFLNQTIEDEAFVSESLDHEVYQVQRIVETHKASPLLLLVRIEVYSVENKLIADAKQLVYVHDQ